MLNFFSNRYFRTENKALFIIAITFIEDWSYQNQSYNEIFIIIEYLFISKIKRRLQSSKKSKPTYYIDIMIKCFP